jgi:hypothetical protein
VHKLFTSFILIFTAVVASIAQSFTPTVISSGGNFAFSSDNRSVSYTFGECFVKTSYIGNYIICEGFQQGVIIPDTVPLIPEVKVFPNPTYSGVIYINLPVFGEINSYIVTVYSMTGKVLYITNCKDIEYSFMFDVDLSKYGRGMYFVKIQSSKGQYLRTFKIEKL